MNPNEAIEIVEKVLNTLTFKLNDVAQAAKVKQAYEVLFQLVVGPNVERPQDDKLPKS
jgi:hypothetical protein